jgi:hypothetical protein
VACGGKGRKDVPKQEEEQDESDDYDAEENPPSPRIPRVVALIVAPSVAVVASSHCDEVRIASLPWYCSDRCEGPGQFPTMRGVMVVQ